MFRSFKAQILLAINGIVIVSLILLSVFFEYHARKSLGNEIEHNALNLLDSISKNIEMQHQNINFHKLSILNRRKQEVKEHVEFGYNVLDVSWNEFKEGLCSEKEAKERAFNILRKMRFDNGIGYFWLLNTDHPLPTLLLHPFSPELEGSVLEGPQYNCAMGKDLNFTALMRDIALEKGEGYLDYLWLKPMGDGVTKEYKKKISYVKLFKPWNLIIGTGVYIDEIDAEVSQRVEEVLLELNKVMRKQKNWRKWLFFHF